MWTVKDMVVAATDALGVYLSKLKVFFLNMVTE
jgi:hypothetical protein